MKSDFKIFGADGPIASCNLSEMKPGSEGVVIAVQQTGPVGRRLLDLGLLPNTPIKVLRRAPLGDPVLYELRGYHLCLRKEDADLVQIRLNGDTAQKTVR